MKFGKVLRYTAMASAIAALSFGAVSANASTNGGDGTTALVDGVFHAHVGASVLGTLAMVEHDAVSFGNLAVTSPAVATTNFAMSATGIRSAPSGAGIVLLSGTYGANDAVDSLYGAARAGSYTISAGDGNSDVYITYLTSGPGGALVSADNTNPIHLTHAGAADILVYNLTDDAHKMVAGDNDVYAGDAYSKVTLASGTANLHIGGTLETTSGGTYVAGPYRGTFDIMLHY